MRNEISKRVKIQRRGETESEGLTLLIVRPLRGNIDSGVGGQLDFIYGASRSKGGVPIIALPSTTTLRDGTPVTRIAALLKLGAGVVTSRNHVRFVVTEYGVADLYGKTIRQRARQLINIAHPDFRADLEKQANELHYL